MPDQPRAVVTNTTPLIALTAATGGLEIFRTLYDRVLVPFEVEQEVLAGEHDTLTIAALRRATWLDRQPALPAFLPILKNSLDRGEASVLQTALDNGIQLVCIDEAVGRRVARLCNLSITGSIGVLLKAQQRGFPIAIPDAINRMRDHGIWISDAVIRFALQHAAGQG